MKESSVIFCPSCESSRIVGFGANLRCEDCNWIARDDLNYRISMLGGKSLEKVIEINNRQQSEEKILLCFNCNSETIGHSTITSPGTIYYNCIECGPVIFNDYK